MGCRPAALALPQPLRYCHRVLVNTNKSRQLIEGNLHFPPTLSPAERLDRYRKFTRLHQHRLRMAHRAGENGRTVARARAQLVDALLQHLFAAAESEARLLHPSNICPLALIAVGGYGRGELAPFSDVDVVFLFQAKLPRSETPTEKSGNPYVNAVVEKTLYALWDLGFKVGHATRTIRQSITEARRELKSRTAMLDARFLAGDVALIERMRVELDAKCFRRAPADFIAERLADLAERHAKHGDTVFLQEPNLKSGCGSLRDAQNMAWMARVWFGGDPMTALRAHGWLTDSEIRDFERAVDFLWRVRNELHTTTARATEILSLPIQSKIASALGYRQRNAIERTETFMRDYYSHSRCIALLTAAVGKRLAAECGLIVTRTPRGRARAEPTHSKPIKLDGLILKDGTLEPENDRYLASDPRRLAEVFLRAQQHRADLGPKMRRLVQDHLARVNHAFRRDPVVAETFLTILRHKGEVARALRLMHETDFLGKYIPEFGRLTCLVQHEFYHRYTADEHTLVALEVLDRVVDATAPPHADYKRLFQQLEQPHLLYLALLLHDTGKSKSNRGHSELSAQNARRVAQRLGLDAESVARLEAVVRHHLAMSQLSQRRDLEDPQTVADMAKIASNETQLAMLHLLTFADGLALGGGVWNEWKNTLLGQLYERTRLALRGESAQKQLAQRIESLRRETLARLGSELPMEEVDAHFDLMPPSYFARVRADEIAEHLRAVHQFLRQQDDDNPTEGLRPVVRWRHFKPQGHSEVVVCTWDRPGLFASIAGSISVAGLNILSATIYTRADHIAVDSFDVSDARLGAATNEKSARTMEQTLTRACRGEAVDFDSRLASLHVAGIPRDELIATEVAITNDASEERTVIEIQTGDRVGLLYQLCRELTALGLNIEFAKISTEKGAAIDTFYVTSRDERGGKVTDAQRLEEIRAAILSSVEKFSRLDRATH
jgi:[protein-PII] uridylyltransferase